MHGSGSGEVVWCSGVVVVHGSGKGIASAAACRQAPCNKKNRNKGPPTSTILRSIGSRP